MGKSSTTFSGGCAENLLDDITPLDENAIHAVEMDFENNKELKDAQTAVAVELTLEVFDISV